MPHDFSKKQLAKDIERELSAYFATAPLIGSLQGQQWTLTTRAIKGFLCQLGHDRNFLVATSGCTAANHGEWLYDAVWYELKDGYLTRQALVAEYELQSPVLPVDDHFQKLVQARADIRLWISCPKNEEIAKEHLVNCNRQARTFPGAMPADTYNFVTADWVNKKTLIERLAVEETVTAN